MSLSSERARVVRAFVYLRVMSTINAVWHWLRRLKQPKYLIGAVVMAAYLGLVLVGPISDMQNAPIAQDVLPVDLLAGFGAVFLFVVVVVTWLVPTGRAALAFSEPEIAFLFPAPLTRVALINFSLLRSQFAIFASAFLLSVVFGRGRGLPGNAWQHATALWLVMATLRLHFLGASFMHERLFGGGGGWKAGLRRVAGSLVLLVAVLALVVWMVGNVRPPTEADIADRVALTNWLLPVFDTGPASIVLAPFRWLVAPLFTGGSAAWWLSLLPALALLGLHYLWVVRAHVSFEEATIDRARRQAERVQALREGRGLWGPRKATARPAPFALAARGNAPVAFLWMGLISAGAMARPRNVLAALAVAVVFVVAVAQTAWAPFTMALGMLFFGLGLFMPWFGALVAQRNLRDTLDQLDIFKAAPVSGSHIALGQLLTPVLLTTLAQWCFLLLALACVLATGRGDQFLRAETLAMIGGVLMVSPPVCMLVLCLPFAGLLWFPAWAAAFSARGGGFEVAGQRLAFGVAFLLVLVVALLPAAAIAFGAWLLGGWFDVPATGLLVGGALAAAVVAAEVGLAIRTLGWKIDRFDLTQDAR